MSRFSRTLQLGRSQLLLAAAVVTAACTGVISTQDDELGATEPAGEELPPLSVEPNTSRIKLLTESQYENAIHDIFGSEVVLLTNLDPDQEQAGFETVGSSTKVVSPLALERFEAAASGVAGQVVSVEAVEERVFTCEPSGLSDSDCMSTILQSVGERAWRRPLTTDELKRYTDIGIAAAERESSFEDGVVVALSGLLQSPNFLYRVELATIPDENVSAERWYDDYEMASRLSFFLWNTIPDEELLAAAEQGELTTDEGLEVQLQRMLASQKFRQGLRNLFSELLDLNRLDSLTKLSSVYPQMSPELGPDAREETLLLLEDIVIDRDADYREFFTSKKTFINRRLAALYQVPAPDLDGFAAIDLPENDPRGGFLTHASFLSLKAKPSSTSAVLRGRFVRETLLCGKIPEPPGDVDFSEFEASQLPTIRQRTEAHLSNPTCAACHSGMDPIGFGLEQFNGIGQFRTLENDVVIEPAGDLDGVPFDDALGLGHAIAEHPKLPGCLTKSVYRYATAAGESDGEEVLLKYLEKDFVDSGHSVKALIEAVVMSDGFRKATTEDS